MEEVEAVQADDARDHLDEEHLRLEAQRPALALEATNRPSAKACGSSMSCIAAKRADGSFVPSSRLFARRIDAIWRFSFSCFFFFVRDTPDGRGEGEGTRGRGS